MKGFRWLAKQLQHFYDWVVEINGGVQVRIDESVDNNYSRFVVQFLDEIIVVAAFAGEEDRELALMWRTDLPIPTQAYDIIKKAFWESRGIAL